MFSKTQKLIGVVAISSFFALRTSSMALSIYLGADGMIERDSMKASAQFSRTRTGTHTRAGRSHSGTGNFVEPGSYLFTMDSFNPEAFLIQQPLNDSIAASAAADALAATPGGPSMISLRHTTLTLAPGLYDLSKFNLNRSTLTVSGAGRFVFNISSSFSLRSANVLLAGGATAANILFNYTGTSDVRFSGRTTSVLNGILLALNARIKLSPGLVVAGIINPNGISPSPGGVPDPRPISVPDASSTLVLISIGFGVLLLFGKSQRAETKVNPAEGLNAHRVSVSG